jgi:hypothetical protein
MSRAERLMSAVDYTALLTANDLARGQTVQDLVYNAVEEFGEFVTAVAVEDGRKQKKLEETSQFEAVDMVICALALFFARGGTQANLATMMQHKLAKWQQTPLSSNKSRPISNKSTPVSNTLSGHGLEAIANASGET